jgi:acetyl esterase/lipase
MILKDDPRVLPQIVRALTPFGMDGAAPPSPVLIDAPIKERLDFMTATEPVFEQFSEALYSDISEAEGIERTTYSLIGEDNNEIKLYVHKPTNIISEIPGILHIHGGGMAILKGENINYKTWRDDLASKGLVVVGVEFRNAAGELGNYPFPAGLNDCSSALQWMYEKKAQLGISKIIISGESGGGNLSLATAIKAKKEDKLEQFDGVYAQCPYISNDYEKKNYDLPSLIENDTYFLNVQMMSVMASVYDGKESTNPLAWPLYAKKEDLEGLPPHVISVNELDPLRDEGLMYYKNLLNAGVNAKSRIVNGTIHAGDVIFKKDIPEVYLATQTDIYNFANGL